MKIHLIGNSKFQVRELTLDEMSYIKEFYSYNESVKKYDWKKKKWDFNAGTKTNIIPRTINSDTLEFNQGFIFSFINMMYPRMDSVDVAGIVNHFQNKDFEITNYYNLEDRNGAYYKVSELLKFKRGILQIPTANGKTEIIATLARNIVDKLERVLVICETKPVLDELRNRIRELGVNVTDTFEPENIINVIKPTGFCSSHAYNKEAKDMFLSKCKYILADEVETTITPTFQNMFECMHEVEYLWGFTATGNKMSSTGIPKDSSLKEILNGNIVNLISYYGFTPIDCRPEGLEVNIGIFNASFRVHPDIKDKHEVISKITKNNKFYEIVHQILDTRQSLFIPSNNKQAFYNLLLDREFYSENTIFISGDGYQLWNNNKKVRNLNLEEVKFLVQDKQVKLILGTRTSYRGIDFHGLDSALIAFEAQSATLRQIIGRLTRGDKFSVYMIKNDEYITSFSSYFYVNMKEIKRYYEKCKLIIKNMN